MRSDTSAFAVKNMTGVTSPDCLIRSTACTPSNFGIIISKPYNHRRWHWLFYGFFSIKAVSTSYPLCSKTATNADDIPRSSSATNIRIYIPPYESSRMIKSRIVCMDKSHDANSSAQRFNSRLMSSLWRIFFLYFISCSRLAHVSMAMVRSCTSTKYVPGLLPFTSEKGPSRPG